MCHIKLSNENLTKYGKPLEKEVDVQPDFCRKRGGEGGREANKILIQALFPDNWVPAKYEAYYKAREP